MDFATQFDNDGVALTPQPWMQLRQVASRSVESVSKSYDPTDGKDRNEELQTVTVSWTNTTPIPQYVYGMVSKSGGQVTLQARSRGYLSTGHAAKVAVGTPSLTPVEVSRFGIGSDVGNGGILKIGGAFAISEYRQNSATIPLMPHVTGWYVVAPGETFAGNVTVRFVSEVWENTNIDGGDGDTQSMVITGSLRVDLFAVPVITTPPARQTPVLAGGASNIKHATGSAGTTTVTKPSSLQSGDVLLAIICNTKGSERKLQPLDAGWLLMHERATKTPSSDVRVQIFARRISGGEPSSFGFDNSLLSNQIVALVPLRNAAPFDLGFGDGWAVASNLSSHKFVEEQIAPSITQDGQFLITLSYFAHASYQSPITQLPPTDMTEVLDVAGSASALAIATLTHPPNPTKDRKFTPNKLPVFSGNSIAVSILVPGFQPAV